MAVRFWHFDTDVYNLHVGLVLGPLAECTSAWLSERMREAWPTLAPDGSVELAGNASDGTVYADHLVVMADDGTTYRFVRIPRFRTRGREAPFDHAVLAHETFHLVNCALGYLGIPHDERDEAYAYLIEHVYRRFLELLYGQGEERCTRKSTRKNCAPERPAEPEARPSANGAGCRRGDAATREGDTSTGR